MAAVDEAGARLRDLREAVSEIVSVARVEPHAVGMAPRLMRKPSFGGSVHSHLPVVEPRSGTPEWPV
jgi:hypothetical protein